MLVSAVADEIALLLHTIVVPVVFRAPVLAKSFYLYAILLLILQNLAMVDLILDFKNWIGINPMQLQYEAIKLTLC